MPGAENTGLADRNRGRRAKKQPDRVPNSSNYASVESYDSERELNDARYAEIVSETKAPLLHLLRAAIREDTLFLLPRILLRTLKTLRRIPRTFFIKSESELARYIFQTIADWSNAAIRITQIKLEVRNPWHLDPRKTYLFISNHRSPTDIPVLFAAVPADAAFVANGLFRKIPAFSYWMRVSGSVFIDQGSPTSALSAFRAMARRLRSGRSLILFPEGHIHQGKGIDEFNRGGIYSAVLAGVLIVPICLYGTDRVMRPGSFHINPRRKVIVTFGSPIDPTTLDRRSRKNIDAMLHGIIANMRTSLENEFAPPKEKTV